MNSDARRSAAPDGESLSRLLQQVLDVVEVRRDMLPASVNTGGVPADRRYADSRESFDELVLSLLRLLVNNHPAVASARSATRHKAIDGPERARPAREEEGDEDGGPEDRDAADSRGDPLSLALSKLLSLVDIRRGLLPDLSPYDESWALLLCATLAERQGQGISVSELCRRIGCALATGQRRVDRMEQLELLDRAPDPDDLRRHSVFPTEKGRKAAEDYAAAVGRHGLFDN